MSNIKWYTTTSEGVRLNSQPNTFNKSPKDIITNGEEAAEALVLEDINENSSDQPGNTFYIEIIEPEELVGFYEVAIDWEPQATTYQFDPEEASHAE